MNLCNNCVIIYEQLPDGSLLVYAEIDCDDVSSVSDLTPLNDLVPVESSDLAMTECEKIKITEIGSSEEELFDDSLESNSSISATPPSIVGDNESGSDKSSNADMRLIVQQPKYLSNDWSNVPKSTASVSQYYEEETLLEEMENKDQRNDQSRDNTPTYYYKTESESELEELCYSDESSRHTPTTSAMSGFTPVVKSSAFLLHKKKSTMYKSTINTKKDKSGTLLSRVQLDDDLSMGNVTSASPQIDVTDDSDSPSPHKLRKSTKFESALVSPHTVKKKTTAEPVCLSPHELRKPCTVSGSPKLRKPRTVRKLRTVSGSPKLRKHRNVESVSTSPHKARKPREAESTLPSSHKSGKSPSQPKFKKTCDVKLIRKESGCFVTPIAVEKSCQLITCSSRSSIGSNCNDRLGAGTASTSDSTESFKRNEQAMSSNFTTPRDLSDQFEEENEEEEEDKVQDYRTKDQEETKNFEVPTNSKNQTKDHEAATENFEAATEDLEAANEDLEAATEDLEATTEDLEEATKDQKEEIEDDNNKKLKSDDLVGSELEFVFSKLPVTSKTYLDLCSERSQETIEPKVQKLEKIEEEKPLQVEKCSPNKRSWADCKRTNSVHPMKKPDKSTKESIKNFIALNKAQLHRGSTRKTYTEIFLERKAKAEAKKREEYARMMGVKIPLRIEEENEEVARPVERMQSSKTAEDNVKGEEEIISKGDVIQAKAMNTETLSTDLKRAHFNIESSRQEISHASSNQKTESLENVKFNVIDDPKMVKILSMKDMSKEKVKTYAEMNETHPNVNFEVHNGPNTVEIPLAGETSNEIINPGAKSATPKLIYRKASLAIGKQLNDNTPEVLFGLKPPVIINKSSSDTDVLKKIADQESQDIKADVSTQEDENSIESTLSTGFIASVKTEGSKISTQSPVPTENKQQEILPDQVSPKQSKGKLEVKTERINRSKKKKLSRQTAGFETEQDVPRNHRSSSLPPLVGGETNQDGKTNNNKDNYKPYTLKDYRQLQLDIQLGGLGPNSDRNVLQEKLQKYQRQANYAQQVMDRNRKLLEAKLEKSKTTFAQVMQEASDPSKDARQRGLNYAKNIKKPPKLDKEENKEPTSNRQVKLPPLRPGNLQSEGAAKVVYLETVEEEEPTGVGSTVKTRPFAMDSLMENVEKLRERHAKEREIVDQLFTGKGSQRKDSKDKNEDKPKKKRSKKK
uniref:Uncharacterized protein n=1 Tax=Strigamia maritima TaxID=126957 RepID=T1IIC0_STRMM